MEVREKTHGLGIVGASDFAAFSVESCRSLAGLAVAGTYNRTASKGQAFAERFEDSVSALAFRFRHGAGSLKTVDCGEGDLLLLRVFARRLAERCGRLLHIENVVDNLEREAYGTAEVT